MGPATPSVSLLYLKIGPGGVYSHIQCLLPSCSASASMEVSQGLHGQNPRSGWSSCSFHFPQRPASPLSARPQASPLSVLCHLLSSQGLALLSYLLLILPNPNCNLVLPLPIHQKTLAKVIDGLFGPKSNGHIPVLILFVFLAALDTADNPLLLRTFHDLVLLLTYPLRALVSSCIKWS